MELNTPRDRENTFAPQLIKTHQRYVTHLDSRIVSLYAKSMFIRKIVATFKDIYEADVSPMLISKVIDAVKKSVTTFCPALFYGTFFLSMTGFIT